MPSRLLLSWTKTFLSDTFCYSFSLFSSLFSSSFTSLFSSLFSWFSSFFHLLIFLFSLFSFYFSFDIKVLVFIIRVFIQSLVFLEIFWTISLFKAWLVLSVIKCLLVLAAPTITVPAIYFYSSFKSTKPFSTFLHLL